LRIPRLVGYDKLESPENFEDAVVFVFAFLKGEKAAGKSFSLGQNSR
jgi:hypothetical protein